ncbi:GNAT family N-acetyltransferase [Tardiphaga alba]|uniref:GNAT family N-acetyltransferase n=1 Tax=Tardiphaga alba TaxID=340268 RepID=A0ABX8A3Z2_9BRAD|nr:GNAT family N-acetyltransferase [Tardiphaga alba]QUS38378.1 GNAT family N-acetyltransferase [Tardiphaga alba]
MLIRRARSDDAAKACVVMRRSISELCGSDHHGDPATLDAWLANKTPAVFERWIADTGNVVLVAAEDDAILAVGAVRTNGEITLNYVSPDARFRGVSRALLAGLEEVASDFGNEMCCLTSTETAHRFYLSCGYTDCEDPEGKFGTSSSYPMQKSLRGTGSPSPSP